MSRQAALHGDAVVDVNGIPAVSVRRCPAGPLADAPGCLPTR